jgi:glycosyltransferase involved in cell wall biosynthesis
MSHERILALLGQRDEPTDAIADYCGYLSESLVPLGYFFETVRVPWAKRGWPVALDEVRKSASGWRGCWVLVQYTALGWSRRGFPLQVLRLLRVLAQSGVRIGVVFHDAGPYSGLRPVDRLRRRCQVFVMRRAYAAAERVILTVPAEKNLWLPSQPSKAVFIPVGANLPLASATCETGAANTAAPLTVAVYGVTGGSHLSTETRDIAFVVNRAAARVPGLRLLVFGRNALEAKDSLLQSLNGTRVALEVRGVLPPEEVATSLLRANLLLFVRGQISSRRGSAIAGIACGLPVVGYAGTDTSWPITEAGVSLVPAGDREALAAALEQVLLNSSLRASLAERSRRAHREYFAWPVIARRYADALRNSGEVR